MSDPRFRLVQCAVLCFFIILVLANTASAQFSPTFTLKCESNDGHRKACDANRSVEKVELLRQISGSRCIFNKTWGYTSSGVWVDRGCRAEFTVYPFADRRSRQDTDYRYGRGEGQRATLKCESNDERRRDCTSNMWIFRAEVSRQISGSPCIPNRTFGWSGNQLWVDKGCRAEFAIYGYEGPSEPDWRRLQGQTATLKCESNDERRRDCTANMNIFRAEVSRQISGSPCIPNRTFGWSGNQLWVDKGCRAEFNIYGYEGSPQTPDWRRGQGQTAVLKCESNDDRRKTCTANMNIYNAEVYRQISGSPCIPNRTFGWSGNQLWVDKGCRAEFTIYGSQGLSPDWGRGGGKTVTLQCSSDDGNYHFCPSGQIRDARLTRQISGSPCVQNRTWGFRNDGVWVDKGCRAEFEIRLR